MPSHKFRYTDLEVLEQHPIQGDFHLLVIGTFNADIPGNGASWFYGRPENEFWCLLPRMMNDDTLHPVDRPEPIADLTELWKDYCSRKRVIIVDVFKEVVQDLNGHGDNELMNLNEEDYIPYDF